MRKDITASEKIKQETQNLKIKFFKWMFWNVSTVTQFGGKKWSKNIKQKNYLYLHLNFLTEFSN